jgi:3-methyladenine DNA glycosylase/8-oxoguanine DNA glycosylase
MRRNPFPIVVPCHRVLASGGKTGGFTAPGGIDTKMRMLEIEGARLAADPRHAVAAGKGVAAKKAAASKKVPAKAKAAPVAPAPKPAPPPTISAKTGLTFDPKAAVRELRARDAVLAAIIDKAGPFRPELQGTQSVFGALSEAIVYQQLTGKAAATIYGRLCALFPGAKKGFKPEHILGAKDEALRGAGLSRAKVAALRDLAQKTADGELPTLAKARRMHDADLVEALTQVRGVGRWTVEMLLMFRLGRPDVLPADDYGVRKGFQIAYRRRELPTRKDLERHGEKWKPWRSVASWYMWRAVDQSKAKD